MKTARNIALTTVCILLGIMLSLQFKSVNYNEALASYENKRLDELKTELIKLQEQKSTLQERLKELEEENKVYEKVKAGDSAAAQQIQDNLNKARIFAGLTDVKGKGIIITLDNNGYFFVTDSDILNVVNELRAAGAQAISVNEERIVAMTEIREAGQYIMINGKQFSAPFEIKAIADPDSLERSLAMIGGVIESLKEDQLKVSMKKSNEIVIKKFVNDGTTIKTDLLTPIEN